MRVNDKKMKGKADAERILRKKELLLKGEEYKIGLKKRGFRVLDKK